MKLAIMQPYFFPYIGYWQLISVVDEFVIYDDVNYIKGGYINRNSILMQGQSKKITLEAIGASSNKLINQVQVGRNGAKLLKSIKQSYVKAPQFKEVFPLLEQVLSSEENNLARFVGQSIIEVSRYLGLSTKFYYSSELINDKSLMAQEKILNICHLLGTNTYINPEGGGGLYNKTDFKHEGIELMFIKPELIEYPQFGKEFVPLLSVIDVLMFNDKIEVLSLLKAFRLE